MDELGHQKASVYTYNSEEVLRFDNKEIRIIPFWKVLLD